MLKRLYFVICVYYCYFHISSDWVVSDNSGYIEIWNDIIFSTDNINMTGKNSFRKIPNRTILLLNVCGNNTV